MVGLVSAIFFTLIIAWLSSNFFKIDYNWYNSLVKPSFTPQAIVFEIFVTLSYLLSALSMARLIVKRNFSAVFVLIMLSGLLSVAFVAAFFLQHRVYVAAALLFAILLADAAFVTLAAMKDFLCAVYYSPILAWRIFLFILMFSIALHN